MAITPTIFVITLLLFSMNSVSAFYLFGGTIKNCCLTPEVRERAVNILKLEKRDDRWYYLVKELGARYSLEMAGKAQNSWNQRKLLEKHGLLKDPKNNLLFSILHTSMDYRMQVMRYANFYRVINQCKFAMEWGLKKDAEIAEACKKAKKGARQKDKKAKEGK